MSRLIDLLPPGTVYHPSAGLSYTTSEPLAYGGPVVSGRGYNPAAHGGTCVIDTRSDGMKRRRNTNQGHEEVGPWE